MPRPLKLLDISVLRRLYNETKKENGEADKKRLLDRIEEQVGCSRPTAYRILREYSDEIALKEKKVARDLGFLDDRWQEGKMEEDWMERREKILDRIVEFAKTVPYSPKVESLLMKVNWVREELKSGLDDGIDQLKSRLLLDFKVDLDNEILKEGEGIPKPEAQEPEDFGEVLTEVGEEVTEEGKEVEEGEAGEAD